MCSQGYASTETEDSSEDPLDGNSLGNVKLIVVRSRCVRDETQYAITQTLAVATRSDQGKWPKPCFDLRNVDSLSSSSQTVFQIPVSGGHGQIGPLGKNQPQDKNHFTREKSEHSQQESRKRVLKIRVRERSEPIQRKTVRDPL